MTSTAGRVVDERTRVRRSRGHAYHADSARAALGIHADPHTLSAVPLPLVHTALGIAVCAVVAAYRPQAVGLRTTVIVSGSLAVASAISLALYDRFVYGRDLRHAVAAMALPIAAIAGFVVVLAGSRDLDQRIPAGVIAALVIGGVPHLGGLRAAGREGITTRLLRDGAGVVVLAPILLAAFGGDLARWSSGALAGCGVLLVSFDALLTERVWGRLAALGAVLLGAIFSGLALALPLAGRGPVRAGLLLLLWYGLRGVAGAVPGPASRRLALVGEYSVFVVAAAGGIAYSVVTA